MRRFEKFAADLRGAARAAGGLGVNGGFGSTSPDFERRLRLVEDQLQKPAVEPLADDASNEFRARGGLE